MKTSPFLIACAAAVLFGGCADGITTADTTGVKRAAAMAPQAPDPMRNLPQQQALPPGQRPC